MTDPSAVEVRDLRYRFGATRAVDGVDLPVAPGEIPQRCSRCSWASR